ncbi:MAG TPA: DUF4340 domain-containing protein [Verrucomicrobiae bacterium]|nr:DUF4340 domain-containing protein [Verrucomicrobiae bacterium]
MKSNTTTLWLVLAAILAAAVWFVEKRLQPAAQPDNALLAGLHAADITSIQVTPPGGREISVIRTNNGWYLERPVAYPATATAVESLLSALEKLTPVLRLSAAETASHKNADAEYGFENPQYTLDVNIGEQSWHLKIGNRTAPGDGVYVRLVGGAGLYVTDVAWLQSLPHDVNAWRDTSLVTDASAVDWLVITNGAKAIELRRDPTNRLWRMIRPLQARADSTYITTALQQLRSAKATRFVTDDPKADLGAYGLQPVELDVWLGQGTNLIAGVQAGKDSTENPGQLFARRDGWHSIVTAAKEALAPWRGDVNDFRDPHLLTFNGSVAEIEVRGENTFTLQRQGSNQWAVAGEKFPIDMENLQLFARLLANMRITEFVKDVVTGPDLQSFGLAPTNSRSITLRSVAGDTNTAIASIIFGATTETNKVFVKRGDEDFVYALALSDVNQLPHAGWQFRDRHIWNFSPTNVTQVTLHQAGKTRQFIHDGFQKWSVAPGSQGMIGDLVGLEESVNQFGSLVTEYWLDRNFSLTTPEQYGFNTNNFQITFDLKSGEKATMDFGQEIPSASAPTAFAAVTLDGDRWTFVFPPSIYQLVELYLKTPPGAP